MTRQFLFDSAFANGAYSHSFGLESAILQNLVHDDESFCRWLNCYMLKNFASSDGAVYALVLEHLKQDNWLSILRLARLHSASLNASEIKQANLNMCLASLKNTVFMHDSRLKKYFQIVSKRNEFASLPVAFALLSKGQDYLAEYAYASIKTLVINATRAVPLSYKKSSELIYRLSEQALLCAELSRKFAANGELFGAHFELEMYACFHENSAMRLFMS